MESDKPFTNNELPETATCDVNFKRKLPLFVKIITIIDLVLVSLKGLIVPFSVIGLFVLEKTDPIFITAPFEVLSNIAILLFGLIANIAILRRSKVGISTGYGNLVFTLLSIIVTVWQLIIKLQVSQSEEFIFGLIIGGGYVIIIRLGLAIMYFISLKKYTGFLKTSESST